LPSVSPASSELCPGQKPALPIPARTETANACPRLLHEGEAAVAERHEAERDRERPAGADPVDGSAGDGPGREPDHPEKGDDDPGQGEREAALVVR
jgi:hypothetical protein